MPWIVRYTKKFLAGSTLEGLTYEEKVTEPDYLHALRRATSLDGFVCHKPCGGSAYEVVAGSVTMEEVR